MAMYPALRLCVQPQQRQLVREILSGWRRLSRSVAQVLSLDVDGCSFWDGYQVCEGLLRIKYRTKDNHGAVAGGPMHYIPLGMGEKWRPLAIFFALAGVLVALLGSEPSPRSTRLQNLSKIQQHFASHHSSLCCLSL